MNATYSPISGKTITIFLAVILILLAVLFSVIGNQQADLSSWKSVAAAKDESAKFWETKDGLSQGEKRTAYATVDVINEQHKKELEAAYKSGLKKGLSNLQSVTSVSSVTTTEIKTTIRDTITVEGKSGRSFTYSDRWTTASGYFLRDDLQFKIQTRDSLNIVQFWKRPSLFKQRVLYTNVISLNPNTTLTGISSTVVRPPVKSRFALVVFAGADVTLRPTVGLGVGYTLIQF